ncbi:MAG: hypothetical protein H6639_01110 [Caldilineaceae bacterium]|nr:hypothetical protein [Caldilineaceae bacterium]MCB9119014.1 hypothetical protein [Caldilineaceae bacterium]MCB9125449.1 hypothetical protein [Caldilineaceae bacterium]
MDSFIGGVFLGIIIGVWLSAAFLFLVLPRQKPRTNSAPPEGQIPPAVSAPPAGQIPRTVSAPPKGQIPPAVSAPPKGQIPPAVSAPPKGQIAPAVSAPPKGQIPPAVADDETIDWPPRNKPKPVKEPPCHLSLDSVEAQELFHQLVVMAHGDHAQAERLVCYEKRRNPNASESMLIGNAIYRWQRDNR